MTKLEQTLSSVEIADMIEKSHSHLIRDIRRYAEQFNEAKIGFVDFFRESTYKDAKGETRPCYRITKKGCEFIAHKLTGIKGTIFTAHYINRFHEMENLLRGQQETGLPWFIRDFRGRKIMLERDFEAITGIKVIPKYNSWHRTGGLCGGRDYNAWGWECDRKEFKRTYGFNYGDDPCMAYLYLCGVKKALRLIESDEKDRRQLTEGTKAMILEGVLQSERPEKRVADRLWKPKGIKWELTLTGRSMAYK